MGMTIKLVHFRPESVLDQVVVIRRNSKINFGLFGIVNFFLLIDGFLLLIIIV